MDKFVGDEVVGLFIPGMAGLDHARIAVDAGRALLRETGHGTAAGPWISVGAGVHTGVAFVGSVGGEDGVTDFTALGDAVNTTARLASVAAAGELLVTSPAAAAAGIGGGDLQHRRIALRGRTVPVDVLVLGPATAPGSA